MMTARRKRFRGVWLFSLETARIGPIELWNKGGDLLYRWGNPRAYVWGEKQEQQRFGRAQGQRAAAP
jgi:hypothetical protein